MITEFTVEHIADLAAGCAILGSGGGGEPHAFKVALKALIEERGPVRIIDPDALAEGALVAAVGFVGAPVTLQEKLLSEAEIRPAIEAMEQRLGRKIDAFIAAEIGGGNGLTPLLAGALMNRPVVDGDGMGRAFPLSDQVTFSIYGCSALPTVIGNEHEEIVVIESGANDRVERITRAICVTMGSKCFAVDYPLSGEAARKFSIKHTISQAIGMGAAIRNSKTEGRNAFAALREFLADRCNLVLSDLFDGKIVRTTHETSGGFGIGRVELARAGGDRAEISIDFQNEFLIARRGGETLASTPDIISLLDADTFRNISSDSVRYGQRVKLIAIEAPALMRTARALEKVGPRAFGFDIDYRSIAGGGGRA